MSKDYPHAAPRRASLALATALILATACATLAPGPASAAAAARAAAESPTASPAPGAAQLPGNSLYRLDTTLTDQRGRQFKLDALSGAPVLITMFYGDCNTACPIVLENLQRTVTALGKRAGQLQVVLVSLDPFHDTPASLAQLGASHKLDPQRFRLAVARDESQTRMLAATLNVKFRVLGGGEISHTTRIALLDAVGSVVATSTRLAAEPDAGFLRQIAAALPAPAR
jgi:protein SCO1/2